MPENKTHGKRRLSQTVRKWLVDRFPHRVKFDEPMSRHTSFRVGGPADAFVALRGIRELMAVVTFCREKSIPCLVMGDGTNTLVADAGIPGMVITLSTGFRVIKTARSDPSTVTVRAMAGVRTRRLCRFAVENGLAGLNFAVGIPGTVGGALMMNAGTPRGCMADVVKAVEVIDPDGRIRIHPRHALDFDYRRLKWPPEAAGARPPILVSGFFRLFCSDPESLREEAAEILRMRREKQPWRRPSAGCFFKNPPGERSAGELIALAGLKGKRIGDAGVSEKHANFIVNTGRATASEILALAETVNETVWKAFGVTLEPEVEIIGT